MSLQSILVYLSLLLAFAYLVNRFVLPKRLRLGKKKPSPGCGQDDCGCH